MASPNSTHLLLIQVQYPYCKDALLALRHHIAATWPSDSSLRGPLQVQLDGFLEKYDSECASILDGMVANAEKLPNNMRRAFIVGHQYAMAIQLTDANARFIRNELQPGSCVHNAASSLEKHGVRLTVLKCGDMVRETAGTTAAPAQHCCSSTHVSNAEEF